MRWCDDTTATSVCQTHNVRNNIFPVYNVPFKLYPTYSTYAGLHIIPYNTAHSICVRIYYARVSIRVYCWVCWISRCRVACIASARTHNKHEYTQSVCFWSRERINPCPTLLIFLWRSSIFLFRRLTAQWCSLVMQKHFYVCFPVCSNFNVCVCAIVII